MFKSTQLSYNLLVPLCVEKNCNSNPLSSVLCYIILCIQLLFPNPFFLFFPIFLIKILGLCLAIPI